MHKAQQWSNTKRDTHARAVFTPYSLLFTTTTYRPIVCGTRPLGHSTDVSGPVVGSRLTPTYIVDSRASRRAVHRTPAPRFAFADASLPCALRSGLYHSALTHLHSLTHASPHTLTRMHAHLWQASPTRHITPGAGHPDRMHAPTCGLLHLDSRHHSPPHRHLLRTSLTPRAQRRGSRTEVESGARHAR